MSVLTRAFKNSADQRYLKAAIRALKPFKNYTHQGGIKARFLDKYDWFEEYPTNPNSFVLNGFMYALLGLYDLWQTLEEYNTVILNGENNDALYNPNQDSKSLFEHGLISLVSLLPLYDTGSGTTYDLRHVSTVVFFLRKGEGQKHLVYFILHFIFKKNVIFCGIR